MPGMLAFTPSLRDRSIAGLRGTSCLISLTPPPAQLNRGDSIARRAFAAAPEAPSIPNGGMGEVPPCSGMGVRRLGEESTTIPSRRRFRGECGRNGEFHVSGGVDVERGNASGSIKPANFSLAIGSISAAPSSPRVPYIGSVSPSGEGPRPVACARHQDGSKRKLLGENTSCSTKRVSLTSTSPEMMPSSASSRLMRTASRSLC